jgi:serine/threonine protein kinase
MLCPDPSLRYSSEQAIEHPWLVEFTKENVPYNLEKKIPLSTLKMFNVNP